MSIFKKIKVNEEALSIIEITALTTLGYLTGKNKPSYVDEIESWYGIFQGKIELPDVQESYQHATDRLIEELADDDPFLKLQIENTMNLLEIDMEGPKLPEEIQRYRKVVDAFMSGVKTSK